MDRTKVETGLNICTSSEPCNGCPYLNERNCSLAMVKDALALLNEQPKIVRCISCAFYRSDGECALHNDRWKPEGFCSWAIRKEGR